MKSYTVKYKKQGQWFWRTIKKVKGDTGNTFVKGDHLLIIKEDESIELIPVAGTQFKFSQERHYSILKQMEEQSSTKLATKG